MKKKIATASTKSKHRAKSKTGHSSYWLGSDHEYEDTNHTNILDLVKYRNAISNFVNIVTGQNIPVNFHTKHSYTDGKTVTISSNLNYNEFDPAVGLALHEGSHILLTDFKIIRNLSGYVNILYTSEPAHVQDHILKVFNIDSIDGARVIQYIKELLNIVEDRRIDNYIFTSAPGYQGYYIALYDKYFNNKLIDKSLKSNVYRDETLDSYSFRICNITNINTDLDALKGLRTIYNILDLNNISRLKTTQDALIIAWEIFKTIVANISVPKPVDTKQDGTESDSQDGVSSADPMQLRSMDRLRKAIMDQRAFVNGTIKKRTISTKDYRSLQSVVESNAELHDISVPNSNILARVAVLPKLTKQMIASNPLHMGCIRRSSEYDTFVNNGIRDGVKLAKKIQRRNEDCSIKFNRLRTGNLDRRRIADIGSGASDIFSRILTTTYNHSIIYLCIDLSGSMQGRKWQQATQLTSMIGKAATMVEGVDAVISVRNVDEVAGNQAPVIMTIFDSRVDPIFQLTNALMNIRPAGGTPEGLCFEAILPTITKKHGGADVYFINISDGEPSYNSYYGTVAYAHTNKQIQAMTKAGIRVLSYFISEYGSDTRTRDAFTVMYRNHAAFVNVSNINIIADTINSKLLQPARE